MAALKIERRDGNPERQVIVGMLVSRAVLGPIASRWESGMFPSRWGNLLGGWAVEHYKKYKQAPSREIMGYFDEWARTTKDRDTIESVESLLYSLDQEYEKLKRTVSPDYVLDQAAKLFNRNRLTDLRLLLEADLENQDIDRALSRISSFRRLEIGMGAGVMPLVDEEAVMSAFEVTSEPLIIYPDAIGNFFAHTLGRDRLISFMGKEKVGKSHWLLDLAVRGVEQDRKVAYFEVGDNSQAQVMLRLVARVAGRPVNAGRYRVPTKMEPEGLEPLPIMEYRWLEESSRMSVEEARTALAALGAAGSAPDRFRMSCHPNSTISVLGIESVLEEWDRDGWRPDVVVIDYADILAPISSKDEGRDAINNTWKAMRGLSQKLHCLVVTATQSNKESYDVHTMRRDNFSEDKRKLAHVNGMIGINQTGKEKNMGLYRLNWVCQRELEYSELTCVWCASCLSVGQPALLSTF